MAKPKSNRKGDPNQSAVMDRCQTPPYAVQPLLPYVKHLAHVWEPAAGEGTLAQALRDGGVQHVIETDLLTGQNFFKTPAPDGVQAVITNPPYSVKYPWLARCYTLALPFALLVPGDVLFAASAQKLFDRHGFEALIPDKRVDFKMPYKGWKGSSSQFSVIWLTWGLGIGRQITFVRLAKPNGQRLAELDAGVTQLPLLASSAQLPLEAL